MSEDGLRFILDNTKVGNVFLSTDFLSVLNVKTTLWSLAQLLALQVDEIRGLMIHSVKGKVTECTGTV